MAFPGTDLDIIVRAYLGADPTADPGTWPAATDLSSRLLRQPIQIRRGRGKGQKTASAGGCVFWLDNTDGALTPTLASSVYYPNWDLGVPMDVSVDNVGTSPPYVRFAGFAADIKMVMVPGPGGQNISAVQVTLGGVIRRLTQGAVVKSAMRRYYENVTPQPTGYWPLESGDGRGVFAFQSALDGGADLRVTKSSFFGVERPFAAAGGISPGPVGAASATDTSSGGYLRGNLEVVSTATQARAEISFLADGFENTLIEFIGLQDVARTKVIAAYSQTIASVWRIGAVWNGPASGFNYAAGPNVVQDNQWHHLQLDIASANGGADTTYTIRVDGVVIVSGTATGYTWSPPPEVVRTNILGTDLDQVCHIAVWNGTSLPTAADSYDAFLGHSGEEAHTRFARVCSEDGIPFSGTATGSVRMGPQPVGDTMAVLRDCEDVDHGMLIEDFEFGFDYRSSRQRENLNAAMTVDLSTYKTTSGTQGEVLAPIRNDARIRNEWTIARPGGYEATIMDEEHQAKRGRYNDSATANVETDDDTAQEASWRVHEGTFDGLRYDVIPLDLGANE